MRPVVVLAATITILSIAAASAAPRFLWEVKGLAQPESVVEDPTTGVIYVSNINGAVMQKDGNGFISRLTANGKMLERQWVKGLNAPTGLALHDRTLYAADVDQLIEINAASGGIVERYDAKGAIFLNDVAVDADGVVYASDTPTNTIWRLKDGSFGGLLSVSLDDQKVSKVGKGDLIGNLDGLEALQPAGYLVTDWAQGALYRVDAKGKADRLIDLNQGSADLTYLPDKKTVLIPMMLDNSLVAYSLD
jgi:sugar lactone lactonase YvrE